MYKINPGSMPPWVGEVLMGSTTELLIVEGFCRGEVVVWGMCGHW